MSQTPSSGNSHGLDERAPSASSATGALSGNESTALCDELLHFGREPLTSVYSESQLKQLNHAKPNGLWLSVGTAWPEWCVGESFGVERLKVVTRVRLADDANVLRLCSARDLDRFTREYRRGDMDMRHDSRVIDWLRVADEYDGIIIAPYVYSRRLELMWYYGWDCASGCIWNARAVASLESVDLAPSLPNKPIGASSSETHQTPSENAHG